MLLRRLDPQPFASAMTPTALLSVSNKEGLVPLAEGLLAAGYQLISSGGTAAALAAVTNHLELLARYLKRFRRFLHLHDLS